MKTNKFRLIYQSPDTYTPNELLISEEYYLEDFLHGSNIPIYFMNGRYLMLSEMESMYTKKEQYIGLGDKNGRSIFEGDIVLTDELNWVGKVVYNYDGFMLVDVRGGFSSPTWKNCVVIGNIHENGELLK